MRSPLLAALAAVAAGAGPASAGLEVTALGKTYAPDPDRVVGQQTEFNTGGSTSVRNELPLEWKPQGYFQRNRDLGQVFTPPRTIRLDAVVLRTGPSDAAVKAGAPGAKVFVQFFEVTGTPRINDNGTPPGTNAKHGFGPNHRCDDFMEGVTFKPLRVVRGGVFPAVPPTGDFDAKPTGNDAGKYHYLRWSFTGDDRLTFEEGKRYAFMVGFEEPGRERGFTLANMNRARLPAPPTLSDPTDQYPGGWGLRREGDGTVPPRMLPPGSPPPTGPVLAEMEKQSVFGAGRFDLAPTTDGYPDVDTYRDQEFYLEAAPPGK